MEFQNIIILVVIIILLIIVINYVVSDVSALTGLVEATTLQKIESGDLDNSNNSNFTYSIWFYIDDWNYRYGEEKVVFGRMIQGNSTTMIPCPTVVLGANQNDITVSLAVLGENRTVSQPIDSFTVANIPIQKWVHFLISAYGRTLDIYIDGKLVRTAVLSGVALIDSNAPVYITPNGGFSGWTSTFQYWKDASDPQKVWNIYKKGYGSSMLGGIFGKYKIKVSLMEGDTEDTTLSF